MLETLIFSYLFFSQSGLSDAPPASSILSAIPARNVGFDVQPRGSAIAVYEKDPHILYLGFACGGVVKSTDGGKTTEVVFDHQGSSAIGCLAVSQKNPDLVWVGTGDQWGRSTSGEGDGVYKSIDGGKTWSHMGLKECKRFCSVLIDPSNENVVYAGGLGSDWGHDANRGVYKSTDGGKTWRKTLFVSNQAGVIDLKMDPKNPKHLIASLWDHIRRPYGLFEVGPSSGIYQSKDGGETWGRVLKGLPKGGDTGLAVVSFFRKDPRYVAAVIIEHAPRTGFYTSNDGGDSWTMQPAVRVNEDGTILKDRYGKPAVITTNEVETRTKLPDAVTAMFDRPFFNHVLEYDPVDRNKIYYGNYLCYTSDGGKTFTGFVHDEHGLWIDPADPKHMIYANDGHFLQSESIYGSEKYEWHKVPTVPMDQVYGIGYDMRKLYWVGANFQDGGCNITPTQSIFGSLNIQNVHRSPGGEGGTMAFDPTDWTIVFGGGAGFQLNYVDLKTGKSSQSNGSLKRVLYNGKITLALGDGNYAEEALYPEYAKSELKLRASWTPTFILSPWDSKTVYFGANYLLCSRDRGEHFEVISPDLTHDKPEWQKPDGTFYMNNDPAKHRGYQTITTINESKLKKGLIWVGTDDGYVQLTQDGGKNWQNVTKNIPGIPEYCWVSGVEASKFSEGRAYVVFGNYKNNDHKTYIYTTEDFGKTWKNIVGTMDPELSCTVIREGMKNPDLLYVGTESSLWATLDRGKSWDRYQDFSIHEYSKETNAYLPTARVSDMHIHPREMDLIIGENGRGIWIATTRALEEMTPDNRAKEVYFTEPGTVYLIPRMLDRYFVTPDRFCFNTQPGTLFSYYLKHDAKEVLIHITDASGNTQIAGYKNWDLIKGTSKAGLNSVRWMNGGTINKPGDYRVTLTVDGKEFYQTLHVEDAADELAAGLKAIYPKIQEEMADEKD